MGVVLGVEAGLPLYPNILAVAMKFPAAEFWVRTLTTVNMVTSASCGGVSMVNMVISMYHV